MRQAREINLLRGMALRATSLEELLAVIDVSSNTVDCHRHAYEWMWRCGLGNDQKRTSTPARAPIGQPLQHVANSTNPSVTWYLHKSSLRYYEQVGLVCGCWRSLSCDGIHLCGSCKSTKGKRGSEKLFINIKIIFFHSISIFFLLVVSYGLIM